MYKTEQQNNMYAKPLFAHLRWFYYSKTCLKRPLKNRKKKILMTNGSLM